MVRKNWRSRNVPKAPPSHAPTHSGSCVLIQLPLLESGCGRMRERVEVGPGPTWKGMISVATRIPKSGPLKRNWRVAKANAAIELLTSWPAVLSRASFTELKEGREGEHIPHPRVVLPVRARRQR